jgi:hypothetical protein
MEEHDLMDPRVAGRFKVVAERPLARMVAVVMTGVLGAALVLAGFQIGRSQAEAEGESARRLAAELADSHGRVKQLERQVADVTLGRLMDEDAYEQLRQTIKGLRDRLAETEEEVRLYRQLMSPSDYARGLRIERLDLRSGHGAREIEFRLLLTQIVENHDWVSGGVTISLAGHRGRDQQVLPLTELAATDAYPLPFRFRYFQDLSGTLTLPDGFTPQRAVVTVEQTGTREPIERTFTWELEER